MANTKWIYCLLLAMLAVLAANLAADGAAHKGHVDVNVWRGPTKGHKKHKFAPWGYHAKLPADVGKKKKKHYG